MKDNISCGLKRGQLFRVECQWKKTKTKSKELIQIGQNNTREDYFFEKRRTPSSSEIPNKDGVYYLEKSRKMKARGKKHNANKQ